ncbi:MAG: type I-F CRISPR-associated endoribonuclease Cas6/Csy4 [Spirochaetales bacterium]|nr:type I-F CRISPR-associated endoribonuclease Cas6/Csy4 [Spirochaetales bacterium]
MNYYQEITLLPDGEIGLSFLWGKVFGKLHIALVNTKREDGSIPVGISFPQYMKVEGCRLGGKLRVFSNDKETLLLCDIEQVLNALKDYVHLTSIRTVPSNVSQYSIYSRVQAKTNVSRLARRKAKRKGISFEDALKSYENFEEGFIDYPYLNLKSWSNGNLFKLFIKKDEAENSNLASFNCYGLSSNSPVPEF